MYDKVILNKFGYYELKDKPSMEETAEYYSRKYYQESKGSYEHSYTPEEVRFFNTQLERRSFLIDKLLSTNPDKAHKLLDIGCGEGWALKYFMDKGWQVLGLDFSDYGCKAHNPDCLEKLVVGNIYDHLLNLGSQRFDCIWLDNVLEHVLDPLSLLETCFKLLEQGGVLVIDVPNDFSYIQQNLYQSGFISEAYWIAYPDHISYFNREGLTAICKEAGLEVKAMIGDYPIDFALYNDHTNYIMDRSKGKACHKQRVALENLFNEISVEKTIQYYSALSELGLGRSIIGFFQKRAMLKNQD